MDGYITKDQAIHAIEQVTRPECFIEDTRKNFAKIIEKLPAADVAPVVHGEWLSGRTFLENAVCSNCKTTYEAYYSKYQYCPRCGSRMDRGESGD